MITGVEATDDHTSSPVGGRARLPRVTALAAVAAALLGLWGGRSAESTAVDGYGLISALPAGYWLAIGLAVPVTALLFLASAESADRRWANAAPALWLVLLHMAPQLAHGHVRSPRVWANLGLIRYIDETSSVDVRLDSRFAWPGFLAGMMAPLARLDDWLLESLLRLWPTLLTAAVAVLVGALGRRAYPQEGSIGPLSALSYVLLAWTGQDLFSPQSVGFLWFMAVLVLIESGYLYTTTPWSSRVPLLGRLAATGGDRPAARSRPVFVSLLILSYAAIVSHPLAPFLICTTLMALGVYGRQAAWRLLVLVAAGYTAWLLVAGEPWWTTGIDELTGETPTSAPGSDNRAWSPEHRLVVTTRGYLGVATVGSAALVGLLMALDRLRHLRPAVPLVPLTMVSALAVTLAGFGGAIIVPLVSASLPMAAVLIGRLLAQLRPPTSAAAGAGLAAVMAPLFLLARFGGESYQFTTTVDREAVQAAYDRADDDTLFVADNSQVPWRDQTLGDNVFVERRMEADGGWIDDVEQLADQSGKSRVIVVITRSQVGWRIHGEGDGPDALDDVARWLAEQPGSHVLYRRGGAWAIEL